MVVFRRTWKKYYAYTFYISISLFAIVHISNYNYSTEYIYLWPLLILPQLVAGMLISYLRVKYNFMLGFALHLSHNLIFILLAFFTLNAPQEIYSQKTKDYTIQINEHVRKYSKEKESSIRIDNTKIEFKNIMFKDCISNLVRSERGYVSSDKFKHWNKRYTLKYKSKNENLKENKAIVLKHLGEHFNFTIEHDTLMNDALWLLYVCNDKLLSKHEVSTLENPSFNVSNRRIFSSGSSLQNLTSALCFNADITTMNITDNGKKYAIELKTKEWEEIVSILQNEYGLGLIKCSEYTKQTKVIFDK